MALLRQLITTCQASWKPHSVAVLASFVTTQRHLHVTRRRPQEETPNDKFLREVLGHTAEEEFVPDEDQFLQSQRVPEQKNEDPLIFHGVPYERIPIAHIKVTHNNTIVSITNPSGTQKIALSSAGTEGFKNAKKGTTIAGQAVGVAAAKKALDKGIKFVRVLVRGLGPGRQTSIKGLELGGLEVISITDGTQLPKGGRKPRKARRL